MKRKYLHLLDKEEYDTITKLVLGTFKIKCKDRTRRQRNAALKYWRHKNSFSVQDGELRFEGKRVLEMSNFNSVVKQAFVCKWLRSKTPLCELEKGIQRGVREENSQGV